MNKARNMSKKKYVVLSRIEKREKTFNLGIRKGSLEIILFRLDLEECITLQADLSRMKAF